MYIPAGAVLQVLAENLWPGGTLETAKTATDTIVWEIRLPRTLLRCS